MSRIFYSCIDSEKREIRLIRLKGTPSAFQIECELFTTSIDENRPYEAISYFWGDSKHNFSISLNGNSFPVTDNLYRALCCLLPTCGTRTLWIDQICINQSDEVERGQQVPLMGDIYSKCSQTILWLGGKACFEPPLDRHGEPINIPKTRPCTWTSSEQSYQSNIVAHYQPHFEDNIIDGPPGGTIDSIYLAFSFIADLANQKELAEIQGLQGTRPGEGALHALSYIMRRPWWNRVWTLQECLLPAKALLMYGPVVAPFEMFLAAASNFTKLAVSAGQELQQLARADATILRRFTQTLTDIDSYRRKQQNGSKINIIAAMKTFRVRETTKDHDKIYGLLGLNIDWYGQQPPKPDYSLEVLRLYKDIALRLIQGSQSLDILTNNLDRLGDTRKHREAKDQAPPPALLPMPMTFSPEMQALFQQIDTWGAELEDAPNFMDTDGDYPSLPSWVPDWSTTTNFEVLPRYNQPPLYSAAGTTKTLATLLNDSTLVLKGVEVDSVWRTSQIMAFTGGEDRSSLFRDWWEFAKDAFAYSSTGLDQKRMVSNLEGKFPLKDAFWRTLCGDTIAVPASGSGSLEFCRTIASDYQKFLSWCKVHEPELLPLFGDDGRASSDMPASKEDPEKGSGALEPAIRAATTMRRIFITKKGLLGMGPHRTVGGEKIYILHGGRAPFILRNKARKTADNDEGPCYELVGDCYVHGLMGGEVLAWNLPEVDVRLV